VLRIKISDQFNMEILQKIQNVQGVSEVICDVPPPKPPKPVYEIKKWNPHINEGVPLQMPPRLFREAVVTASRRLSPSQFTAILAQMKIEIISWIDQNPVVAVVGECEERAVTIGEGVILYVTPRSMML
jgi:hypothetical protein